MGSVRAAQQTILVHSDPERLGNSSLGTFIAFPELANVFMGSTLTITGAAIPIVAMTMAVYLAISLITSLGMNIYNARMTLVER